MINYNEQAMIRELRIPERVTIVGCGGTGSWVSLFCALSGVARIRILDGADVDERDIARLPLSEKSIGKAKVHEIKQLISLLRPDCDCESFRELFTDHHVDSFLDGDTFGCVDDVGILRAIRERCARNDWRFSTGVYSGLNAVALSTIPEKLTFARTHQYPCWVGSNAIAAALAVTQFFTDGRSAVVDFSVLAGNSVDAALRAIGEHGGKE